MISKIRTPQPPPLGSSQSPADLDELYGLAFEHEIEAFRRPRLLSTRSLLWMAGELFTATATGAGYGRFAGSHRVQIDPITLSIPGLPARLAGKRIAQISDIHVGAYFTPEQLAQVIARVNQLGVDFLMLTGDFATVREQNLARREMLRTRALLSLIEPLRQSTVPMFAIAGNHDYWARHLGGLEPVARMLREAGATLLRNQAIPVDDGLWLAGVEDVWGGRPDLVAALRSTPAHATTLLMAHSPDYFDNVVQRQAPVAVQFRRANEPCTTTVTLLLSVLPHSSSALR